MTATRLARGRLFNVSSADRGAIPNREQQRMMRKLLTSNSGYSAIFQLVYSTNIASP